MAINFSRFSSSVELSRTYLVDPCEGRRMDSARDRVRLIRLALSGAVLGVALVGVIARALGYPDNMGADVAGAGVGFASVLAFKFLHLV